MDDLQRVTFRFGRDSEVHYLDRLPSVGDRVAHEHELWVVTDVDADALGAVVICERPTRSRSSGRGLVESLA